ncbi:MAG: FecR domain-containing protein [Spirochaetes bacterium]|nr:FecR domain-containing protein [Spirochaetota bacterium]
MKRHITAMTLLAVASLFIAPLSCKKAEEVAPLTLFSFLGDVKVKTDAGTRTPTVGESLTAGNTLMTGDMAMADILLEDRGIIRVHQNSTVLIDSLGDKGADDTQFSMTDGKMYVTLSKLSKGGLRIKTPTAVASVRGTVFRVSAEKGVSRLDVVSGRVAINPVSESRVINEVEEVVEAEETVSVDKETAIKARKAVEKNEKMKLVVRDLEKETAENITSELRNVRPEMMERLEPKARREIREKLYEKTGEEKAEGKDREKERAAREKAARDARRLKELKKENLISETEESLAKTRLENERAEAERKEKAEKERKEKEARERASNIPTL